MVHTTTSGGSQYDSNYGCAMNINEHQFPVTQSVIALLMEPYPDFTHNINSRVVNKLTKSNTHGKIGLHTKHAYNIIINHGLKFNPTDAKIEH